MLWSKTLAEYIAAAAAEVTMSGSAARVMPAKRRK